MKSSKTFFILLVFGSLLLFIGCGSTGDHTGGVLPINSPLRESITSSPLENHTDSSTLETKPSPETDKSPKIEESPLDQN